jgi:hypothetical protein
MNDETNVAVDAVTEKLKDEPQSPRIVSRGPYRRVEIEEEVSPATSADDQNKSDTHSESPDDNLSPEEKNFKKRYGDLRAYHDRIVRELKDKVGQLEGQLKTKIDKNLQPPKTLEELQTWREKYPEVYQVIESIALMTADDKVKTLSQQLEDVRKSKDQEVYERSLEKIRRKHPDFDDVVITDEFRAWVATKSKSIYNALYENSTDPDACIEVLDLYKYETRKPAPQKKVELKPSDDAAAIVSTKSSVSEPSGGKKKIWKTSEISKLTLDQFVRMETEIDQARREGRVVDDLQRRA